MDDYSVGPNGEDEELHSQSEEEEEELEDAGLFVDDGIQDEEYQDVDADAQVDDDPLRTAEGLHGASTALPRGVLRSRCHHCKQHLFLQARLENIGLNAWFQAEKPRRTPWKSRKRRQEKAFSTKSRKRGG